ncbi:Achaete-scute transcription factor-related [Trema orientale]|uniref:Achaete-scute transcription factor-related n=1 Tax=Trema orientale TaxID=63057 RepID=A0A2P5F3G3_TREOI|nr:Achaete-scute transcription factor-related [Trema orientale]
MEYSNSIVDQQNFTTDNFSAGKVFSSKLAKERKSIKSKHLEKTDKKLTVQSEVEEESYVKKQDHNAKERQRRMKLSESYLALGSLLPPNSRPSKKRWTAPVIVDKVLHFIPELENEIEQLTLKKKNMQSALENMASVINKKSINSELNSLTISVNEVKKGELILQICRQRDGKNIFSRLLKNIEEEGICIVSASTLRVCDERECYNIHIQDMS